MTFVVGDLFSGIGGFALAGRWMGWEKAFFSEIDPYACAVLAHHWPNVPNLGDITQIDWRAHDEALDLLCGGFPCQDISLAGKGHGIKGKRSGLWKEIVRCLEELRPSQRPRWLYFENVPALRTRGLHVVLRDLAALGYDAEWHCVPAAAVGAPHRRDRVWLVAYARKWIRRRWAKQLARGHRDVGRPEDQARHQGQSDQGRAAAHHRGADDARTDRRSSAGKRGRVLAYPEVSGEWPGLRPYLEAAFRWGRSGDSRGAPELVNGQRAGLEGHAGHGHNGTKPRRLRAQSTRSVAAAGVRRGGHAEGTTEPALGGDVDGLSGWLDAATERLGTQVWPAGPDEAQHDWEPPRVTPKNVHRRHRLTAIGNAIVPQVAYVFMLAIAMADADLRGT